MLTDEENRICAAIIENKDGRSAVKAGFFIDATGDGDLAKYLKLPFYRNDYIQPPTPCFFLHGRTGNVDIGRLIKEHGSEFGLPDDFGWGGGVPGVPDTELRAECRKNNIEYAVIKNTLLRFAFNNVGLNELDDQLNGTTSLAVCMDDPVAPARVIADYAKKLNGKFEIKGGFMEGKVVSLETVNALAAIPALPVLQAQVLGTMLAPISALACVLKQIAEKNGAPAEEAAAE